MNARILLVEDNHITRKAMVLALRAEGHTLTEASTGSEAIGHAVRSRFDLVLQDLRLPDMDGFELLRRLRQEMTGRRIPIMAVSGMAHRDQALRAGFDDLMVKPVEPSRLVRAINLHLSLKNETRIDVGAGRDLLLVDDDPVQLRLHQLRLQQVGFTVRTARNGQEALAHLGSAPLPAAVVSDMVMPHVDGLELCRAIRADARLATLPVLLISAEDVTEADADLADKLGASATVFRAPDLEEVLAALRIMLASAAEKKPFRPYLVAPATDADTRRRTSFEASADPRSQMWRALVTLMTRLNQLASHPSSVSEVLTELLAELLDAIGCPTGAVYLLEADQLVLQTHQGFSPAAAPGLPRFWGKAGWLGVALRSGRPMILRASHESDEVRKILRDAGGESMLLAPIALGRERLGMLMLVSSQVVFPDSWVELARAVVVALANAITLVRTIDQLTESERRFREITDATADAIMVADKRGELVYGNPAAETMTGYTGRDLLGRNRAALLPAIRPDATVQRDGLRRADGTIVPVEVTARLFRDRRGSTQEVFVVRDLSHQVRAHELAIKANRDTLTGLYNRRRFQEEIGVQVAAWRNTGLGGALLVLDLDEFKAINDTHGHAAGDAVLRSVGEVLLRTIRTSDMAARLGGDEFVMLLAQVSSEDAMSCAERIVQAVGCLKPRMGDRDIRLAISIGVAMFPIHGETAEALFLAADDALYRAKQTGRNQACKADTTRYV